MKFIDENERENFEERAGIAQFDARMTREQAEQFAWQLVLEKRKTIDYEK